MALLINGISEYELEQIGKLIYGPDKFGAEQSTDKEQVEIWMGFKNKTFVLSDYRLDGYFIRSKENKFVNSLFSKFNTDVELLGFYDNDTDLPAGFSYYRKNQLQKRLIRNSELYLVEDFGPKSEEEQTAINKLLPNYESAKESVKEYLDKNLELASQYSEDKPTLYIDKVVDDNLTQFTDEPSCYFDFYYGFESLRFFRDKELTIMQEDLLDMKGSYPFPSQNIEPAKPKKQEELKTQISDNKLILAHKNILTVMYKVVPPEYPTNSFIVKYKVFEKETLFKVKIYSEVEGENQAMVTSDFSILNGENVEMEDLINKYIDKILKRFVTNHLKYIRPTFPTEIQTISKDDKLDLKEYYDRIKSEGKEDKLLVTEVLME